MAGGHLGGGGAHAWVGVATREVVAGGGGVLSFGFRKLVGKTFTDGILEFEFPARTVPALLIRATPFDEKIILTGTGAAIFVDFHVNRTF